MALKFGPLVAELCNDCPITSIPIATLIAMDDTTAVDAPNITAPPIATTTTAIAVAVLAAGVMFWIPEIT